MTRETKIGLLVGLAFIIVIGILLSDHFRSTMEPPRAMLDAAGATVRSAVAAPGATAPAVVMVPPTDATPKAMVPTQAELTPPPSPVVPSSTPAAAVAPAAVGTGPVVAVGTNAPAGVAGQATANAGVVRVVGGGNNAAASNLFSTTPSDNASGVDPALASAAKASGEEIVPVNANADAASPVKASPVSAAGGSTQAYVAQPGDTLYRIASRVLAAPTKANQQAIVKLNPGLQENPNKVIVGQTYRVPVASAPLNPVAVAAPAARAAAAAAKSAPVVVAVAPSARPSAAGVYTYTVADGDTLWGIASDELNDTSAPTLDEIQRLNKDVLKGRTTVRVGMKLRLPAKPVASAN